jgi:MFS family permease
MRFLFGGGVGFIMASAPKIMIETVPAHLLDYGFGSSTNLFTFISVALLLTLGIMNGTIEHERLDGYMWKLVFLFPIPFSLISILGFFTIYPRDSAAFLIETGGDAEEVMEAAMCMMDFKNNFETRSIIRGQIDQQIRKYYT